jgi:molybdate transport system substrate-binding protein
MSGRLCSGVVLLTLLLPGCHRAASDALHVSAAVSLTEALTSAVRPWEERTGRQVVLNFAASNVLARQIEAGAAVDLFISADEKQMQRLIAGQIVAPNDSVPLLSNQLVIVTPAERSASMVFPAALADPDITHLALGDPEAVPAGVYAKQWLERVGLWQQVAGKVVPCASVRAALAAVEAESAEAAIVYKTDALGRSRVRVAYEVPIAEGPRILYPAAAVRSSAQARSARELLSWLQGPEARATFTAAGFGNPAGAAR